MGPGLDGVGRLGKVFPLVSTDRRPVALAYGMTGVCLPTACISRVFARLWRIGAISSPVFTTAVITIGAWQSIGAGTTLASGRRILRRFDYAGLGENRSSIFLLGPFVVGDREASVLGVVSCAFSTSKSWL